MFTPVGRYIPEAYGKTLLESYTANHSKTRSLIIYMIAMSLLFRSSSAKNSDKYSETCL